MTLRAHVKRLRRWLRARVLRASAYLWRRLLWRTTVVAITGSVGKTTTKECLAAILASQAPTLATRGNQNDDHGVPRTLLRLRPWHRFAVIEIGTDGPGRLLPEARLARPHVGIVLAVASTHTDAFPTLDDTEAEKAQLLAALPRHGLAILNGEDPRVARMAAPCRILRFGRAERFDACADELSARWPERLGFRVRIGGETQRVETRLVGAHWLDGVLAALLAARELGVPLAAAARALAGVAPFTGRMQPVRLPNGATLIRDEQCSTPPSWQAALAVLREARAGRRVLVASDLSDVRRRPRERARDLADRASEAADAALFVGEHAEHAAKRALARGMAPENVAGVRDVRAAAAQLAALLRDGDLVLLKGRMTDHLSRILFAQLGSIECWATRCRKRTACDGCAKLRPGFDLAAALSAPPAAPGSR